MAKAMKAMKAMAAMKAMKTMKKKRVSKKGSKAMVLHGTKEKTTGGLAASALTKNKYGKIVSKKQSALGKQRPWMIAVQKARKALKITGFVAVKKGSELYKKAKEFC